MAEEYVRQHIVPKRYLDRFASCENDKYLICTRYHKKNSDKQPTFFIENTSNVGYLKNFYDVKDKADPKYWEHYFSEQIDSLCGPPLERIIQTVNMSYNGAGVLTAKDRHVLSKLIVAQMLRVPSSVEYVQGELYKRVSREVKADTIRALSCLPAPLFEKCEEQVLNAELSPLELKEYYLDRSFSPERFDTYCDILNHRIYVVFYNTRWKIMPFITSDNPVIVEGIGNEKAGLFHNGMASPSTCIYFPINPAVLIASYSRDSIIASTLEKYDNQLMVIDDLKYVCHVNMMEIAEAYQHSFIPQPLYDEIVGNKQDCASK